MAMAQATMRAFEELKKKVGTELFLYDESLGISETTFNRYYKEAGIKKETVEKLEEYTLEEVLELLNSCAGDDCYDCSWNFQTRDNRIYDVSKVEYYRFA